MTIDGAELVAVAIRGDAAAATSGAAIDLDLSRFQSGRWALQLDGALAKRRAPVVIVARGVAALAVAWWAQLSPRSYMTAIHGGILLSPLAIDFGQGSIAAAARAGPVTHLPFPSIVTAASATDIDRTRILAEGWGSLFPEGPPARPASAIEAQLVDRLASTAAIPPIPLPDRQILQTHLNSL